MKLLKQADVKGKRVLVRCDFNISFDKKGESTENFRIEETISTIKYLIENNAKVILLSHLGRPEGKVVGSLRLDKVAKILSGFLKKEVRKLNNSIGNSIVSYTKRMKEGDVILLENVQFHKGEIDNDPNYAKELSKNGDIFVMEAFGQAHREYASIVSINKYLPCYAGFLFEKEVEVISKLMKSPEHPFVVVMGGVKIDTKVEPIRKILPVSDHILFGGEIANVILRVKGITVNKPLPPLEITEMVKEIDFTNSKIHLPFDVLASLEQMNEIYVRCGAPGTIRREEMIYDIGPETILNFKEILKEAKTILWNGPLGLYEEKEFENGTKEIAQSIAENNSAFRVIGGGDTISAVSKFNLLSSFNHVSTGGGAMLDFIAKGELPGIKALE